MSALEVRDLVVGYETRRGRVIAVDGIDITIQPGETVALVGETGSGKTTAALASIGLLPQGAKLLRGSVTLGRTDITRLRGKRLERLLGKEVGLIPQDPTASLDPLKPIGWQIGEVLRIHGERSRERIEEEVHVLLERVGLTDAKRIAQSYPHELSGGQRQRALIAGAVALRPALIVADESTSALDVTVQRRVLDLIDEIRREDRSGVLLVTHDLGVAAERADRIIVLRHGVVEDDGPIDVILGGRAGEYTRTLVANAPALNTPPFRDPLLHTDAEPEIVVNGLVKRFGAQRGKDAVAAVNDVSFTVARGTTHAIVGQSGSGKSTIARILMGFESATSGSAVVSGRDATTLPRGGRKEFWRHAQYVYQSPYASLDPTMSVLDIVAEPLIRFGIADRRAARVQAAELLHRVALDERYHDRRPRELSGGQRQRVAIARALAPDPRVVILDEPVSALDVTVQAQILDLLEELQRERGLTYVFISHDLAVVRRLSDTVTVLRQGEAVEQGPVRSVFEDPQHEYTRALLDAIPRVVLDLFEI
ncbi:ABC transporter ATP-binding protein [Microbacterium sp. ZW T5_56]|uniref:ABC transporter ATP-binding protein n=1 Tax=Microbacterium sp. ZW T5_56 TaxID=3378081 RepID=UPI0038553D9C